MLHLQLLLYLMILLSGTLIFPINSNNTALDVVRDEIVTTEIILDTVVNLSAVLEMDEMSCNHGNPYQVYKQTVWAQYNWLPQYPSEPSPCLEMEGQTWVYHFCRTANHCECTEYGPTCDYINN